MAKRSKSKQQKSGDPDREPAPPLAEPTDQARTDAAPATIWYVLSILLALVGLVTSGVISYVYLRLAAGGGYQSFCAINATVNCDAVLSSPYGTLFGRIPVSFLAIVVYLTMLVLLAFGRNRDGRPLAYALALAVWDLLYSIYLALIAWLVLGQFCLLCAVLYLVNLCLVFTIARARRGAALASWRVLAGDLERLFRRPLLVIPPLVGAVAVLLFLILVPPGPSIDSVPLKTPLDLTAAPTTGATSAVVSIAVFSDFQCPACRRGAEVVHEVMRQWGDRVRVHYLNYPLDPTCNPYMPRMLHEHACRAAVAARCAMRQGKFWPYHDLLFANQEHLTDPDLGAYAAELELDPGKFQGCMDDPAMIQEIQRDIEQGQKAGIKATPSFVINNQLLQEVPDVEAIGQIIEWVSASQEGQGK